MSNGLRTRENVAGMGRNHPTLAAYRAAVQQMKSLPESDPRNWRRQALIHFDGCPHGNWYFLPWHRKYILDFEKICRDLSGNLITLMSPLDPIFWLHHCNIDRLWAEWNAPPRSRPNTSSALWSTFTLRPFNTPVRDLQSITQLGYTYDTLAQPQLAEVSELPLLMDRASNRFELMEPQAASLGQEASFSVQTPESAVPRAAAAVSAADVAEDGGPKVLAFVQGVEPPEHKEVSVNVFLNCPYLSAETPLSDPHYVGNFTFFGVHEHEDEAEGEHDMKMSFAFDLTEPVARLRALEPDIESRLTVQLMPVPLEGRDVPPEDIEIEGVEIVYI